LTNKDLKGEVLQSIKWVAAGRATTQMVSWITTFWVIRLLTPDDYGVVTLAMVVSGLILMLIDRLFLPVIVKDKELDENKLKQLLGLLFTVITLVCISQFLFADYIGQYYNSEIVADILKVQIIGYICLGVEIIPRAMLTKSMEFKKLSIVAAIANLTASILTLTLAFNDYGYWSLVIGTLAISIIRSSLTFIICPVKIMPLFRFDAVIASIKFGSLITLHGILFYAFLYMDVAIAGKVLTVTEVGIWAVCIQIATMPLKKILPLINQVAFPAFSKIQEDFKKVGGYVIKAQRLSFVITIPLFWGMAMVMNTLIPLVIGDKWLIAAVPTSLLLFVMPFRFSDELFNPALQSIGKIKHMIVNVTIVITIMFTSLLIGTQFGILGLAYSWGAGFLCCYFIVISRNFKIFEIDIKQLLVISYAPLMGGLIMCGTLFFVQPFLTVHPLLSVILQIGIGGCCYLGTVVILNRPALNEIVALYK
jgi:O-antigen/teichoic acid export membrane protein